MNNKSINFTKLTQFDDSEPHNSTLSPEPESHEPMETASPIEKDATQNNWLENEIFLLCGICSAENIVTSDENDLTS